MQYLGAGTMRKNRVRKTILKSTTKNAKEKQKCYECRI